MVLQKRCSKCFQEKPLENFSNDKTKPDGKYPSCKICKSQSDKSYRINNLDKVRTKDKVYYQENKEKICERSREWYQNNREYKQGQMKEYYTVNYTKIKETQAKWDERNRAKITEYMRNYIQQRKMNDVHFSIRISLRSRFQRCIKHDEPFKYLGCDIDFFKSWIEYQFHLDPKLNWKNHGEYWHYDHIIPCAAFDLTQEEQIYECFHWSNLRPVYKQENLSKSGKVIKELIDEHRKVVDKFCQMFDVPKVTAQA
jgi:hypothetical protein